MEKRNRKLINDQIGCPYEGDVLWRSAWLIIFIGMCDELLWLLVAAVVVPQQRWKGAPVVCFAGCTGRNKSS